MKEELFLSSEKNLIKVYHIEIGKRTPLHCTAVGKAIMAYLSKDKVATIVKGKGLEKYTENTITNEEELKKEFLKIRKQGYAVDNMGVPSEAWQFLPVKVRIRQRLATSLTPIPHARG